MQILNRGMMARYEIEAHVPSRLRAVQFGTGEALLGAVDRLIDGTDIGVCVVQTGGGDAAALGAQDGMYTLVIRGEADERRVQREQVVQCVLRAIDPGEDFAALTALAAEPGLGLALLDTAAPDAATALALAARLLCARRAAGLGGLDFICLGEDAECAARAREMIGRVAAPWGLGADFGEWLRSANAFAPALCESLAFRADAKERARLCAAMNYEDALVHAAEPFVRLTVAADADLAARWLIPGVEYAPSLDEALALKRRVYDAGLFAMAAPGWLLGCETLADCMRHAALRRWMGGVWMNEILPGAPLPRERVAERVIETCARFENPMNDNRILNAASGLLARFVRGALPIVRARAAEDFEPPRALAFALAATIMLYAGARPNAAGEFEVARGSQTAVLRDDPEALAVFARLSHDMPPESLAYAALADRELWQGADLRDIEGLESRVALDIAAMQRDPGFLPEPEA